MSPQQAVCHWKAPAGEEASTQSERWGSGSQGRLPGEGDPSALNFTGHSKQRNALEKEPAQGACGAPCWCSGQSGTHKPGTPRLKFLSILRSCDCRQAATLSASLLIYKVWAVKARVRPSPRHREATSRLWG